MNRTTYYEELKTLARDTRRRYGVQTDAFGLREMRVIYKCEGIRIDLWHHRFRKIRAAYLVDADEPHVMLNASMKPVEPRLFSLAHELKHHYVDRDRATMSPLGCQTEISYSRAPVIEIGAEVFAAELIFPEEEFRTWSDGLLGSNHCTRERVVELKRVCPAKISYTFLVKRLERCNHIPRGAFRGTKWVKLEEELYGVPFYRRRRSGRGRP